MRNYSYYPSTPGFGTGNMSMIQGKFMPSNPNFVGVGANKNFNPYRYWDICGGICIVSLYIDQRLQ